MHLLPKERMMQTLFRPDGGDHPLTTLRRLIVALTLLLGALGGSVLGAVPAGAQSPESELNLNAYHCPADYDQVSDCTKLDGVTVDVSQDGQPLGQLVTKASEGVTMDLMVGAFIELSVVSGAPEGTALEESTLSFDAVEGMNAVTLVFVDQEAPPPPHSDTNALVVQALLCPVEYDGNNYASDCGGEEGIGVTAIRDADSFTVEGETDADGVVGFQGLGEGTYTVELGVPGDFADFLTVCGVPGEAEARPVTNPDTNRIEVYLGPTDEMTCTFFIVPVDAVGDPDPTPAPKPTEAPVTNLPTTGTGSATPGGATVAGTALLVGTSVLLTLAGAWTVRRERI
jgi:hypothetical protein